jgi:hypothetical protein
VSSGKNVAIQTSRNILEYLEKASAIKTKPARDTDRKRGNIQSNNEIVSQNPFFNNI